MDSAPLLTAKQCYRLRDYWPYADDIDNVLEMLIAGRVACYDTETHVAVQKMTEAEAVKKHNENYTGSVREWTGSQRGYLTALRDMKAIKS